MKRLLSLALVAVLSAGMGVSGFAADSVLENIKGFYGSYTLADGVQGYTPDRQLVDMGDQYAMDEPKLVIDLKKELFDGDQGTSVTTTQYWTINLNVLASKNVIAGGAAATIQAEASNADRIAALNDAIQATIDGGSSLVINGVSLNQLKFDGSMDDSDYLTTMLNRYNKIGSLGLVSLANSQLTTIDAARNVFFAGTTVDGDGVPQVLVKETTTTDNRNLTTSEINKSKLTLATTVRGGSKAIKSIELVKKDGQIVMKLQNEWVSTKEQDVEVLIYLKAGSTRLDDQGLTVLATLKNPEIEVYKNYDYVDISRGYIAKAVEFNSGISVDIGNGVTIDTKLFANKLYYGITTREADEADNVVFRQYPDVDNVITLKTVGFTSTGDVVRLDTDSYAYYVYDKDMKYLGRADEKLPFSTKYYLANKKLDTEPVSTPVEESDDDEDEELPPVTGSTSTTAAPNVNLNPGTGR